MLWVVSVPTSADADEVLPEFAQSVGSPQVSAELLLLEYDRTQGPRVGFFGAEAVEQEFIPAVRGTIAVPTTFHGTLLRARGFLFDWNTLARSGRPQEVFDVGLWSVDGEIAKQFDLGSMFEIDVSAGVRFSEFTETMRDDFDFRQHEWFGVGPVAGIEARAKVISGAQTEFTIFGRARGAVLFANGDRVNDPPQDESLNRELGQVELAGGIEFSSKLDNGETIFFRIFGEYQRLINHTSKFPDNPGVGLNENVFAGAGDVWLLGAGVEGGVRW